MGLHRTWILNRALGSIFGQYLLKGCTHGHAFVDIVSTGDSFLETENSLVDPRHQNPVGDESWNICAQNRVFSHFFGQGLRFQIHCVAGLQRSDDFNLSLIPLNSRFLNKIGVIYKVLRVSSCLKIFFKSLYRSITFNVGLQYSLYKTFF